MRYLRKIASLTLVAVAMTAVIASTAAADVTVDNPGQFTISDTPLKWGAWSNGSLYEHYSCPYDADGYVNEDGSLAIENISFSHGSTSACIQSWDDCDDAGWSGQIVGPGHPDYLGVADFEALMTVCVMNGTTLGGVPFEARIHIDGDVEDQQWSWPVQNAVLPGYGSTPHVVWSQPFGIDRTDFGVALAE